MSETVKPNVLKKWVGNEAKRILEALNPGGYLGDNECLKIDYSKVRVLEILKDGSVIVNHKGTFPSLVFPDRETPKRLEEKAGLSSSTDN